MNHLEEQRTMRALARRIAPFLDGFTPCDDPKFANNKGAYLVNGNARLHLGLDWQKPDRLEVSGAYPLGTHNVTRVEHFKITVALKREPRVIAQEITRRLLPDYLPEAERVAEAIEASESSARKRHGLGIQLKEAFPPGASYSPEQDTLHVYSDKLGWGKVRVMHAADSVHLDLHGVPTDLALAIAHLIRDWNPEG